MATTRSDIRQWLKESKECHTHMLIVCDTFDYEDYPIYVAKAEDVQAKIAEYHKRNMQKVMEVYDLSKDIEPQLLERRTGQEFLP